MLAISCSRISRFFLPLPSGSSHRSPLFAPLFVGGPVGLGLEPFAAVPATVVPFLVHGRRVLPDLEGGGELLSADVANARAVGLPDVGLQGPPVLEVVAALVAGQRLPPVHQLHVHPQALELLAADVAELEVLFAVVPLPVLGQELGVGEGLAAVATAVVPVSAVGRLDVVLVVFPGGHRVVALCTAVVVELSR